MLGRLTPRRHHRTRLARALEVAVAALALALAAPAAWAVEYSGPVDDYATYQPQSVCRHHATTGAKQLAAWITKRYDGTAAATLRPCSGGSSEHKDGRAIDWTMDAAKKADRREVAGFLDRLFATDADGNEHALARRMGIMYVIWDDHIWSAYGDPHFDERDYLNSACPSLRKCSKTLRHRDHVHISLSKPGGRAATTWYSRSS